MRKKILIADDEADIVSMLRAFFESKGYFVLSAVNGTEALKQVEQEPDIILLSKTAVWKLWQICLLRQFSSLSVFT